MLNYLRSSWRIHPTQLTSVFWALPFGISPYFVTVATTTTTMIAFRGLKFHNPATTDGRRSPEICDRPYTLFQCNIDFETKKRCAHRKPEISDEMRTCFRYVQFDEIHWKSLIMREKEKDRRTEKKPSPVALSPTNRAIRPNGVISGKLNKILWRG